MLLMSYMKNSDSRTTTRRFLFSRMAKIEVLNVISQIVESLFVFCIRRTRGESVRATSEVENSISKLETSPSVDSECLLNGSVVYKR